MKRLLAGRRPRVKISKRERLRRFRLGDLRVLFEDRCRGRVLPDDDAGRDYLRELLLPISLGPNEAVRRIGGPVAIWGPTDRMRREIESWAPWMSEDETAELIDEINLMPPWQRKPMARTLGKRLNVPYGERARLGLRTIGPCDMTEAERQRYGSRRNGSAIDCGDGRAGLNRGPNIWPRVYPKPSLGWHSVSAAVLGNDDVERTVKQVVTQVRAK